MTLSKTYKKAKIKYSILAAMNLILITHNKKKNTYLLGIIIIHLEAV